MWKNIMQLFFSSASCFKPWQKESVFPLCFPKLLPRTIWEAESWRENGEWRELSPVIMQISKHSLDFWKIPSWAWKVQRLMFSGSCQLKTTMTLERGCKCSLHPLQHPGLCSRRWTQGLACLGAESAWSAGIVGWAWWEGPHLKARESCGKINGNLY